MKKVIFLNSGHSEKDPGAVVPRDRFSYESTLNMAIRDFLVPELEAQGFKVEKVPDELNLTKSYLWVNARTKNLNSGLALSIHNNCCGGEGAESYYYGYSKPSKNVAQKLVDEFCKETGLRNRGAKSDTITRFGELSWIRETNIWATLLECAFLDSNVDMEIVMNDIPLIAKGITKGVCQIFNIKYIEKVNPNNKLKEIKNLAKEIIGLTNQ